MTGITLVLGGGGFKGLAHLGVLCALEEAGVPVERVVGSSAGALIGACYCGHDSAAAAHELVMSFVGSEAFQKHSFEGLPGAGAVGGGSLVSRILTGIKRQVAMERMYRRSSAFGGAALRFIVRSLVPKGDVQDLGIPLAICALDLVRGEEVLITRGNLASAVVASSSVPGYFPAVERDGTLLCDPGIVNNLPTLLARSLGASAVVAVDLSAGLAPVNQAPLEMVGIDVLFRAQDVTTRLANRRYARHADVVIAPELGGRSWLDASDPAWTVAAGHEATERVMPSVKRLLEGTERAAG